MATLVVTFQEIVDGAAGAEEAKAAQQWLRAGAPVYKLPDDLQAADEHGYDCTIRGSLPKKRRRTSGDGVDADEVEDAEERSEGKTTQPAQQRKQQRPSHQQQSQQPSQPSQQPQQSQQSFNLYSRAAFLGHGDVIGLASRRKARGPTQFQLPDGWRMLHNGGSSGSAGKAAPKPAAAGKKGQQTQQQQQQYLSPEGMLFSRLQDVEAVLTGPVLVPRKLVRWIKAAAADPLGPARQAPETAVGQAHLLGLKRVRVVIVPEERRLMERRVASAAAEEQGTERRRRRGM